MTYSSFILAIRQCCEKAFRSAKRIVCLRRSCARVSVEMNGMAHLSMFSSMYLLLLASLRHPCMRRSPLKFPAGGLCGRSAVISLASTTSESNERSGKTSKHESRESFSRESSRFSLPISPGKLRTLRMQPFPKGNHCEETR